MTAKPMVTVASGDRAMNDRELEEAVQALDKLNHEPGTIRVTSWGAITTSISIPVGMPMSSIPKGGTASYAITGASQVGSYIIGTPTASSYAGITINVPPPSPLAQSLIDDANREIRRTKAVLLGSVLIGVGSILYGLWGILQ